MKAQKFIVDCGMECTSTYNDYGYSEAPRTPHIMRQTAFCPHQREAAAFAMPLATRLCSQHESRDRFDERTTARATATMASALLKSNPASRFEQHTKTHWPRAAQPRHTHTHTKMKNGNCVWAKWHAACAHIATVGSWKMICRRKCNLCVAKRQTLARNGFGCASQIK